MMKKTQNKLTYITRTLMMVMTSILIILFLSSYRLLDRYRELHEW